MQSPLQENQRTALSSVIDDEYASYYNSTTHNAKQNILYNIINIKADSGLNDKLYLDIKNFIKHYVLSTEEQDTGYDLISVQKVFDTLSSLELSQQYALLKVFVRHLNELGFEEEKGAVEKRIHEIKIEIERLQLFSSEGNFVKLISLLTTKSLPYTIYALIVSILVEFVILLPAYSKNFATLNYQYINFTKIYAIDNIINIFLLLVGFDEGIKITPVNWIGALQIIAAKLLFVVIVANFLLKNINDKFKF